MRRFDDALTTLQEAANRDPSAPSVWTWTGIVRGARGEFKLAKEAIEKAVGLGDESAATQCYYAYILARSGSAVPARRVLASMEQPGRFSLLLRWPSPTLDWAKRSRQSSFFNKDFARAIL